LLLRTRGKSGKESLDDEDTNKMKTVQIWDVDKDQQMWQGRVSNEDLLGQLKTGINILINGHFYQQGNVIKIRYDLLSRKDMQNLEEYEVFDYFRDVLNLDDNEAVKTS